MGPLLKKFPLILLETNLKMYWSDGSLTPPSLCPANVCVFSLPLELPFVLFFVQLVWRPVV